MDCVSWHPNCNYILSGSNDKTVRMWSYSDAQCVRLFQGGKGAVTCLSFSPDGKLAASAGEDRKVRVWDLAQGSQVKELRGHSSELVTLTWCQDSRNIVSGGSDGSVRVWDTGLGGDSVGESVAQYSCGGNSTVIGANFTDTNTLLMTSVQL